MHLHSIGRAISTFPAETSTEVTCAPPRKRQKLGSEVDVSSGLISSNEVCFELFRQQVKELRYKEIEIESRPDKIRDLAKLLLQREPETKIWLAVLPLLIRPAAKLHCDPSLLINGIKHLDPAVRTVTARLVIRLLKQKYIHQPDSVQKRKEEKRFRPLIGLVVDHLVKRLLKREELKEVRSFIPVATDRMIARQMVVFGKRFHETAKLRSPVLALFKGLYRPERYNAIGEDPDLLDLVNDGKTRLMRAAQSGDFDEIEYLLDLGADVNRAGMFGKTPLFLAVVQGSLESVKALLNRGANLNLVNQQGCSPFRAAILGGHADIVKLLLEHGANSNERLAPGGIFGLHYAVYSRNQRMTECFLDCRGDVNMLDPWGSPLLMVSIWTNDLSMVQFLLDKGAEVNLKDRLGQTVRNFQGATSFLMAVWQGNLQIVQLLVKHRADIEQRDSVGRTPLIVAAMRGHTPIVAYLLDQGADPDAVDDGQRGALDYANPGSEVKGLIRDFGAYEVRSGSLRAESIHDALSSSILADIYGIIDGYDGVRNLTPPAD